MNRYKDAYLVARGSGGLGRTIQVIGQLAVGVGALGFLGGFLAAKTFGEALLIPLGILSIFGGILLFCVRIIIASQGQLLKATLDTAINSSPFLSDDQRAKTMSL
jgi:hypothetical protein